MALVVGSSKGSRTERTPAVVVQQMYDAAYSSRSNFQGRWQRISEYGLANRDFTTISPTQGRSRQRKVYSTTFQEAHEQYISAIQALMIPEGANWESLEPPPGHELMDRIDVKQHYEMVSRVQMASYNNPAGGFYRASGSFIFDYGGFGNGGALFIDWNEEDDCVQWTTWPLQQTFYITDSKRKVIGFIRRHEYTPAQAVDAFGEDMLHNDVKVRAADPNQASRHSADCIYYECIHPADRGAFKGIKSDGGHPWISVVVGAKEKALVRPIQGFWEQPIVAIRHTLNAGEDYGRGPGDRALPDQRNSNVMFKDMLDRAQLDLRPPMAIPHRGLMSPVRQFPGGQTVYQPSMFTGSVPPIFPIQPPPSTGLSLEMFNLVLNQIKQAFLWDLLQPFDERYMSATQILELAARTTQLLGPNFSAMRVDWFLPQSARVYGLNKRHGKLPATPPWLRNMPVHVTHKNPAMAAQMAPEVNQVIAFAQWLNEQAAAMGGNTDIYDPYNMDEMSYVVAEGLQMPARIYETIAVRDQKRQAKNEAAEAQAEMDQFATVAESAGKAAPALKVLQGGAGGAQAA